MVIFGNTNFNGAYTDSSDTKRVSQATPDYTGRACSITARIGMSHGTGSAVAKGVIYADNGGVPGALLAVSDEMPVSGLSHLLDFNLSDANRIMVYRNTPYWIGVHIKDPGEGVAVSFSIYNVGLFRQNNDTYSNGPSNPFGATSYQENRTLNAYVNYIPDSPVPAFHR